MLGKRLGKQMGAVAGAVRMLSTEQLLAYEAGGSLEVAGVTLGPGDVKIFRDFKPPAGVTPGEQSAGGWGVAGLGVAGHLSGRVGRTRQGRFCRRLWVGLGHG